MNRMNPPPDDAAPDFLRAYYLLTTLSGSYRAFGLATSAAGALGEAACELIDWGRHAPGAGSAALIETTDGVEALAEVEQLLSAMVARSGDLATTLRLTRTLELVRAAAAP
jgi:hypothetical protein